MKIKVSVYINGIRSDHSSLERYRIQSITIDRIVNDIRKRGPDPGLRNRYNPEFLQKQDTREIG